MLAKSVVYLVSRRTYCQSILEASNKLQLLFQTGLLALVHSESEQLQNMYHDIGICRNNGEH